MRVLALALAVLVACVASANATSITVYGAVANDTSVATCKTNSLAITKALIAANSSTTDRTVLVPAGQTFCIMNGEVSYLRDVTFQIDGKLLLTNNMTAWPENPGAALQFSWCTGLTITGGGEIDGQGYDWWWKVLLTHIDHRPNLVNMFHCTDTLLEGIWGRNSPEYHFFLMDMVNLHVKGITVRVDVIAQKQMLAAHGHMMTIEGLPFPIPTFPLNTDGIDPSGTNILIEDCDIENFDDAVAVKPSNAHNPLTSCSENITIRNSKVSWGVGMTIGSVPPDTGVNCVRNVTFDNISFDHPIKAIYIKTNPGTEGTGIIDQITYKNIYAKTPLWYPIWIGPQQQQQPGSKGTGCSFLYPIVDQCPTQPRVPISNIVLQNVTMDGGLTLPGVLLCNSTKPCTDYTFTDVTNTGSFLVQKDYVCKNVVDSSSSGSVPPPPCFGSSREEEGELY